MILSLPLVALIALASCDRLFNLQTVESRSVDASVDGERPEFCMSAAIFDTFDGSEPCEYGSVNGLEYTSQAEGVLDIRFSAGQQGLGGCTIFQELNLTDAGVFTHVSPLDVSSGYTILTVRNHHFAAPAFNATIIYTTGALRFVVNDVERSFRDDVPGWWRIRRPSGTDDVAAEVSFDGITWEPFGVANVPLPPAFALDIGAGLNETLPAAVAASFSVLGVCD